LVVEAVIEDMGVKQKVFKELDAILKPEAILCTNTSSLSVTTIAEACQYPQRVVGMHFFNPVEKMPLVEVIRGTKSSDQAVATTFQFAKRLGKTPILVKDSPGFLVNRILGPYLNEAVYLISEGVTPSAIDRAMEKFGMPMGPCELLDEVGLDVAAKVSKVLYGAFGARMQPPTAMELVVGEGRLGKKSGKGIYVWEGKQKSEDSTLLSRVKKTEPAIENNESTIQKRLSFLMVNEGARCLKEQIVRDAGEVDLGMIFGTGFAPFRGGLLRYADSIGIGAIAGELEIFEAKIGSRYQPCELLREMAVSEKRFFS
jgi:3-hydroxyacyl-CoA dehydrogenase/enoyl-CoA hydratase/3-hydroxybutyryl-CoA epimerase